MDEYLFRAKRIRDSSWVYGGIMKTFHPNFEHESEETFRKQKPNCLCICTGSRDIFVEQRTVGQFIGEYDGTSWEGLTPEEQALFLYPEEGGRRHKEDWRGRRIFEGDIVESIVRGNRYVVSFAKCGFFPFAIAGWECVPEPKETRVIGNIYDNPELVASSK